MALVTTRLVYRAHLENIDSGCRLEDPRLLQLCDGVAEPTDLSTYFGEHVLPDGLDLQRASAILRYDTPSGLVMSVELSSTQELVDTTLAHLAELLRRLFESDWNYELALPSALDSYQVHFETTPIAIPPDDHSAQIAALAADWPAVTFEQIAALSDVELDALLQRLQPVAKRVRYDWSTVERAAVRALLEAAETNKQRRAVDRLAREAAAQGDDFL